ncbi:membrane protein YqaA, SNARE-associated domain [Desulfonispora thiosulfatigenes DSM 11270]|uniref:Membrane protein YqaA, SNARE-associated domain n=1 Tax=Desulfonispora thiosulfatigenes DSM 11270 TaxID=656914 RepID=A0A1W1VAL2_DESTI|nr:YqaA family protein [Desulfonispora thiosulfatigenes]SMB90459.1 membrane protein YqaA, SNARE-associated domain [Desulfonispora thiosulfatigenes DSM 11270]
MIELLQGYGLWGIFILSFLEAIFFPVPVEAILIPFLVLHPDNMILAIFLATMGCLLGGIIGYKIGQTGGVKVAHRFISPEKMDSGILFYHKYGGWALALAILTPLPYKVFTIVSGILQMNFAKFVYTTVWSRLVRITIISLLTVYYGAYIFENALTLFMNNKTIFLILVLIIAIAYGYYRHRMKTKV